MRKATIMEALENTAPQPVCLICTPRPDNNTNLAPVAWWTFLESEPPMLGFSMAKESYTCELVSGRGIDKAKEYGIEMAGGSLKYPVHSKLVFICNVSREVIVGECVFFICNIDEILLDENRRHIYTLVKSQSLGAV